MPSPPSETTVSALNRHPPSSWEPHSDRPPTGAQVYRLNWYSVRVLACRVGTVVAKQDQRPSTCGTPHCPQVTKVHDSKSELLAALFTTGPQVPVLNIEKKWPRISQRLLSGISTRKILVATRKLFDSSIWTTSRSFNLYKLIEFSSSRYCARKSRSKT
jgi:hypothetical protein